MVVQEPEGESDRTSYGGRERVAFGQPELSSSATLQQRLPWIKYLQKYNYISMEEGPCC